MIENIDNKQITSNSIGKHLEIREFTSTHRVHI